MNNNHTIKVDTNNINNTIGDIDLRLKELEEKILVGKTEEEQEKIKKEWEDKRTKFEDELNKKQKEFNNKKKEWEVKQSELIPTDKVRSGLNEMMDNLDKEWNEIFDSAINELCEGKSEEEKQQILKAFTDKANK